MAILTRGSYPMLQPQQQETRSRPHFGYRIPLVAVSLLVVGACEDVVVRPVEVETIQIVPGEAQVSVGGTVQMSALLRDEQGRTVTGHPILWTSEDPAIATVSSTGSVEGVGSGSTTIRGQAGAAEGTAMVRVLTAPAIVLSSSSVEFAVGARSPPPAPVDIAITNTGEMELTGLEVAVSYSPGASGWLAATLSGTTAPATLTVGVAGSSGLAPGVYEATVLVSATSAPGGAVPLAVSLEVEEEGDPPLAPSDLSAQLIGPGQIALSWTAQDEAASEFRIERRLGGSTFQTLATVDADSTTFVDGDVASAGEYTYRVRACNDAGCSEYSDEATIVIAAATIVLSLESVEFTMASGGEPPPAMDIAITNGGDAELTGLDVAISYSAGASGWLVANLSGTTAPATLTVGVAGSSGLAAGVYEATILVSATSVPGGAVPLAVSLEVQAEGDPPLAPSNLSAQLVAADQVALSWTAQDEAASEFRIERRLDGSTFQPLATVDADSTTFVDTGLAPHVRYTYRVRACNDAGCSEYSNEATAITPPAAPSGLTTENVQKKRVRLAWTDNSTTGAVFQIERAVGSAGGFTVLATTREGATSYDDRDVDEGNTYSYRVRACNGNGCSLPSNTITVTTPN
jgi:hypothetical protein